MLLGKRNANHMKEKGQGIPWTFQWGPGKCSLATLSQRFSLRSTKTVYPYTPKIRCNCILHVISGRKIREFRMSTWSTCRNAISGLDGPSLLRQSASCPLKHHTQSILDSIFWFCGKSNEAPGLVLGFRVKVVGSVNSTHCFLRISTRAALVRSLPVTASSKAANNSDAMRFEGLGPWEIAASGMGIFGPSSGEGLVEVGLLESFSRPIVWSGRRGGSIDLWTGRPLGTISNSLVSLGCQYAVEYGSMGTLDWSSFS